MNKRIAHLIVGLGKGGAETTLFQVVQNQIDTDIAYMIISLGEGNYYEDAFKEMNVELYVVSLKKHPFKSIRKVVSLLHNVDTLCCWMYHANLIGYFAGKCARVKTIIWNIRHSELGKQYNKRSTLLLNRICAKLSKHVSVIAYNGHKAREIHEACGYSCKQGIILNNGVNIDEYIPNITAKQSVCAELGIPQNVNIILSVTRNHPIKDIPTFIAAFSEYHSICKNAVAVICGAGVDYEDSALQELCKRHGLISGKSVFLLGQRQDVPRLMAACDLYVLHSAGEAFPNVLVQAMACGCMCIATDVGDVKEIISDSDCIFPVANVHELVIKMQWVMDMLPEERNMIGRRNRQRVLDNFQVKDTVLQYEEMYRMDLDD